MKFSGSDGSVGQSDCGYPNTLLRRYLTNEIVFVIQPHVDMSKSWPAVGDLRMELGVKVIIAVGNRQILFEQSLYTYRNNTLLATT